MTYSPVWYNENYDVERTGHSINGIENPLTTTVPYYVYEWSNGTMGNLSSFIITKDDADGQDIVIIGTTDSVDGHAKIRAIKTKKEDPNITDPSQRYTLLWEWENDIWTGNNAYNPQNIHFAATDSNVYATCYYNEYLCPFQNYQHGIAIWANLSSGAFSQFAEVQFLESYPGCRSILTSKYNNFVYTLRGRHSGYDNLSFRLSKTSMSNMSSSSEYDAYSHSESASTWTGLVVQSKMAETSTYLYFTALFYTVYFVAPCSTGYQKYYRSLILKYNKNTGTTSISKLYKKDVDGFNIYQMLLANTDGIEGDTILLVVCSDGLRSYNSSLVQLSHHNSSASNCGFAYNSSTKKIYYRANTTLHSITLNEDGSFTNILSWTGFSSGEHSAAIAIDNNGLIVVGSNYYNPTISNVHIFEDNDVFLDLKKSFTTKYGGAVNYGIMIGDDNRLYIPALYGSSSYLYAYGQLTPTTTTTTPTTTTTTTTTTTPSPTTTTTTTGTGPTTTSTTTTTPTTTTTTTTPAPLSIVQTTQFDTISLDNIIPIQSINASDDSSTQNALLSQSFSFGTIAPNQTSKIIIVQLNIPRVKAITNIKIGLISSGNIEFDNDIFGISKSVELRDDITPDDYFLGVNEDKLSTNIYNIDVANKNDHTSEYVYLNINLPQNQSIGEGIIRYKWFFDYA